MRKSLQRKTNKCHKSTSQDSKYNTSYPSHLFTNDTITITTLKGITSENDYLMFKFNKHNCNIINNDMFKNFNHFCLSTNILISCTSNS